MTESATLTYNPGAKKWDFLTSSSVTGMITITNKGLGKKLTKLKATGPSHVCVITYDTDSKIAASNGDFFSVFKIAKCTE